MGVKKVLTLTILLEFCVISLVFILIQKVDRINYKERPISIFSAPFPSSEPRELSDENWIGYSFKEGLRIFYRISSEPIQLMEDLKYHNFENSKYINRYIPLGDSGVIAYKPLRKGYSLVALAALDTIVMWVDIKSQGSTLDSRFRYFNFFLKNIKINQKNLAKEGLETAFSTFRREIPIVQMQDLRTFLYFIIGITLFGNLITFLALFGGGTCPRNPEAGWEIVTPSCMVYEKLPIGQRSYSACLIKQGFEIMIFTFGRKRKTVNLKDLEGDIHIGGKTLRLGKQFKIELPNEETLQKWQALLH